MTELEKARELINETDKEMARLFEQRLDAVKMVSAYKREHGLPVEDLAREKEMIKRNVAAVQSDEYRPYYVNFLQSVVNVSKSYQHRLLDGMRVAYSGVEGAFANLAAKRILPQATSVPYGDFAAAYDAVVSGQCDCALLPVENSFNGDVGKVLDLAFFGPLYVTGVYETEIVQNLLGVQGASIADIEKVVSHPQALGQCAAYINQHGFETVEAANTAVAAQQVAEMGQRNIAAIGSEEAAAKFGLVKLDSHINESNNNTTRFAMFSNAAKAPSKKDNHFILLFTVKNIAGSLGQAVSVIGEYGFNLRALKSRPTKELIWEYYFYAEGEGNIGSKEGKAMLNELMGYCSHIKVLGSYEKEVKL